MKTLLLLISIPLCFFAGRLDQQARGIQIPQFIDSGMDAKEKIKINQQKGN